MGSIVQILETNLFAIKANGKANNMVKTQIKEAPMVIQANTGFDSEAVHGSNPRGAEIKLISEDH